VYPAYAGSSQGSKFPNKPTSMATRDSTEADVSHILAGLVSSRQMPHVNNNEALYNSHSSRRRKCKVEGCPNPSICHGRGNRKSCPAHPQYDVNKRRRRSHRNDSLLPLSSNAVCD